MTDASPSPIPLPVDKYDLGTVERLRALPPDALVPHVGTLLEWIQDANWPIALPMAGLLATLGTHVVPAVRSVFAGTDGVWKERCISLLLARLDPRNVSELETELRRLVDTPSQNERDEDVPEAAATVLHRLDAALIASDASTVDPHRLTRHDVSHDPRPT